MSSRSKPAPCFPEAAGGAGNSPLDQGPAQSAHADMRPPPAAPSIVKPYYEHAGIVWYTVTHETLPLRMQNSRLGAHSFRGGSPLCHWAQPESLEKDEGTSQGDCRRPAQGVEDKTQASPAGDQVRGCVRVCAGENGARQGRVAKRTHPRRGAHTRASSSSRRGSASHQRESHRQRSSQPVRVPRPPAPWLSTPIRGRRLPPPSRSRFHCVQGWTL